MKDYFLSCSADWSVKLWIQDKTTPLQSFSAAQVCSFALITLQLSSFSHFIEKCKWCVLVTILFHHLWLCQWRACGNMELRLQQVSTQARKRSFRGGWACIITRHPHGRHSPTPVLYCFNEPHYARNVRHMIMHNQAFIEIIMPADKDCVLNPLFAAWIQL